VQFALPEVVERLRAGRSGETGDDEAMVVLNAGDPANLYGPALDDTPQAATGEPLTFARVPSTWLVQQRGLPILIAGDTGTQLTTIQGADEATLQHALSELLAHLAHFETRITVESWNGQPALDSPGRPLLEAADFYRDYPGMTWRRPQSAL
jgi:hypothetical protein